MRLSYYSDTDTLYLELKDAHGTHTQTCGKDIAIDFDADDEPLGIEIEHASSKTDLARLKTEGLAQRTVYDPAVFTRDVLIDTGLTQMEPLRGMTFQVEVGGNGDSARIVSDTLSKQTEFEPGQELLR